MTWVAFDRAGRLARDRGLPAPVERWRKLGRPRRTGSSRTTCWDPELGAYVMHPGSQHARRLAAGDADGAVLRADRSAVPVARSTGSGEELVSDSLVHRYAHTGHDGLDGEEGTFNLCSFWYVDALTRAGRVKEARMVFEKMLTYANHVGLYAEEIGPSGEALGNFPQAFTHLALISAAVNLDRALDR